MGRADVAKNVDALRTVAIAQVGHVAQLGECLLSMYKALGSVPSTYIKLGVIMHTPNLWRQIRSDICVHPCI